MFFIMAEPSLSLTLVVLSFFLSSQSVTNIVLVLKVWGQIFQKNYRFDIGIPMNIQKKKPPRTTIAVALSGIYSYFR